MANGNTNPGIGKNTNPGVMHNPISQGFAQDLVSREGQRPRCPCGGESGSEDAAPPRGLCASRFTIPLYLHTPKCAGVKNALRPYRLA